MRKSLWFAAILGLVLAPRAYAASITFENLFPIASGPATASAYLDWAPFTEPFTFNTSAGGINLSLTGGVPLIVETNHGPGFDSTVYATASPFADGIVTTSGALSTPLVNPILFSLSAPATHFGLTLLNAFPGLYRLEDVDHPSNFKNLTIVDSFDQDGFIVFSGSDTATLDAPAMRIQVRFLGQNDPCLETSPDAQHPFCQPGMLRGWDFAVDNVTFDDAPRVPEPATLALLGSGLVALAAHRARSRKTEN